MHTLFSVIFFLAGTLLSAGSFLKDPRNTDLTDGAVRVRPAGQVVFQETFEAEPIGWKPLANYAGRLSVSFGEFGGENCMMLRYAGDGTADTAWGTASPIFNVPKSGRFSLTLLSSSSSDTSSASGKGNYQSRIEWYGPRGRTGSTPFRFRSLSGKFYSNRITGSIPPGTVQARIHLGYDFPNIPENGYQALAGLVFSVMGREDTYGEEASFESKIFPAECGAVSREAFCPPGTAVRLQLACAPDHGGKPGKWSPWFGADGKKDSFFQGRGGENVPPLPPEMRWMKYRAVLLPARKTPILSAVVIGSFRDEKWTDLYDLLPPFAENTSTPGRLSVRIHDASPVNWRGLRFSVDGRDVTEKVTIRENEVSYPVPKTAAPGLHSFSVSAEDLEGNGSSEVIRYFFAGEPFSGKIRFAVGENGIVLRDGKPFFPLILLSSSPDGTAANALFPSPGKKDFSLSGTLKTAAERKKLLLAPLQKAGSGREALLQQVMDGSKDENESALLGWHLAENRGNAFDRDALAETADLVKAVSPGRLTVQTGPAKILDRFAGCTDVFLLDPSPRDGLKEIRSGRERLSSFHRPRALWVRLRLKDLPEKEREKILRCRVWLSVIQGASGIFWDGSGLKPEDEIFSALNRISGEIRSLVPCLAEKEESPEGPPRLADGSGETAPLICTLRHREGKTYLFAANPGGETVKAAFYLPGITAGEVCFSGRTAGVEKNVLTDTFGPFDVNIYELR